MNRRDLEHYEYLTKQKTVDYGCGRYTLATVSMSDAIQFHEYYTDLIKTLHLWNVKEERTKALRTLLYQARFDVFQFVRLMMERTGYFIEGHNTSGNGLVMDLLKKGDIPLNVRFNLAPLELDQTERRGIIVLGYYSEPEEPDGWIQWKANGHQYIKHTLPWSITESHILKEKPPIGLFGTGEVKTIPNTTLGIIGIKVASAYVLRDRVSVVEVKE